MKKIVFIIKISFIASINGLEFSYRDPKSWGLEFPECLGKEQSPIDIDVTKVIRVDLPPLEFKRFNKPARHMNISNTGYTIELNVDCKSSPMITGGPLKDIYFFDQFHFHWGPTDQFGSERSLNNRFYPLELHMVFFNTAYGSKENALEHADGLAVLGFFFDVSQHDNAVWNFLLSHVSTVAKADYIACVKPIPSFDCLLPKDLQAYYTYHGSLTTPPCNEIVTWIDFKSPIYLSHRQLEEFRRVYDKDGKRIKQNFRPQQARNNRPIYSVSGLHKKKYFQKNRKHAY